MRNLYVAEWALSAGNWSGFFDGKQCCVGNTLQRGRRRPFCRCQFPHIPEARRLHSHHSSVFCSHRLCPTSWPGVGVVVMMILRTCQKIQPNLPFESDFFQLSGCTLSARGAVTMSSILTDFTLIGHASWRALWVNAYYLITSILS